MRPFLLFVLDLHRGTHGLDPQHEAVWDGSPRLGGGGLLLRRGWSADGGDPADDALLGKYLAMRHG
jgi:hypothetical protein